MKLSCHIYFLHKAHWSLLELRNIMDGGPFKLKYTNKNVLHSTASKANMCLKFKAKARQRVRSQWERTDMDTWPLHGSCLRMPMSTYQNPSHSNRAVNKSKAGKPADVKSINCKDQLYFLINCTWLLFLAPHISLVLNTMINILLINKYRYFVVDEEIKQSWLSIHKLIFYKSTIA